MVQNKLGTNCRLLPLLIKSINDKKISCDKSGHHWQRQRKAAFEDLRNTFHTIYFCSQQCVNQTIETRNQQLGTKNCHMT